MLTPEQITPMRGSVLVRLDPKEEMSKIIVTPEHLKKDSVYGKVLKVGRPLVTRHGKEIPSALSFGDRVFMGANKGSWVNDTPGFKNSGPARDDGTGNDRLVLVKEFEIEGVVG